VNNPELKFDLQIKYGSEYGAAEERAMIEVLREGAPTSGVHCREFEKEFAAYCGTKYARVTANGTAAIFLALLAAGVGKGQKVITTPLTWIATAAAAETLGATVDFVDIDRENYNLDPSKIENKITDQTSAIIPVHLFGQCCDMDPILQIAEAHGLRIIEDACHAIGAEYRGRKAGSLGTAGCFSFHEQKNISTLGEGGMVVTNDPELYEQFSLYRSHCTRVYGDSTKYCRIDESKHPMGKRFWYQDFDDVGYNFRMTDIQAAVGRIQLKKLDEFNRRRRENAEHLTAGLKGIPGLTLPKELPGNKHVFHLFPILVDKEKFGMSKEDFIYAMLYERGIKVGVHYIPLHYSTAYRKRGFTKGQFPITEAVAEQLVTLPISPRQTEEALEYLIESIRVLSRQ
jgi:dTDP-4-amino-4,6-dideoxygalactose transaminase